MAVELVESALFEEVAKIAAAPGSPYHRFQMYLTCGGKNIPPLKYVRQDVECNYREAFSDDRTVVFYVGLGTLINYIAPFKDDITITTLTSPMDEFGYEVPGSSVETRTYKAYLADDTESNIESSNNPILQDFETAERSSIRTVTFTLEEMAVSQLRMQSTGVMGEIVPPYVVLETLMNRCVQALQVPVDEKILKVDLQAPSNQEPRAFVVVRDGTMLVDIPDLIQNEQGGIYSTGLGFYVQDRIVYFWPVYDVDRFDQAPRVLRIIVSPNRQAKLVDRTWYEGERTLTILSAGMIQVVDDSMDHLNNDGNGVRYQTASALLDKPVSVANNKMTASRSQTTSEFVTTVRGDGMNNVKLSSAGATDNIFLESSKLAKRSIVPVVVTWQRSQPTKIIPGMPTEVIYDYNGEVSSINAVVLHALHSYENEGRGPIGDRMRATTVLTVGISRDSPEFAKFLKSGGQISPSPAMAPIEVN